LAEQHKKELMMNLISLTYLNLSRNEKNKEYLLSLSLFKKLKILIEKYFLHEQLIKDHAASA
jgi:Leucine-rich repeat (LRR) protein